MQTETTILIGKKCPPPTRKNGALPCVPLGFDPRLTAEYGTHRLMSTQER